MRHLIVLVVVCLGVAALPASAQLPDTTPPTINCGTPDGAWHADDVAIPCTASDAESGLANAADASFALFTSVPAGMAASNAFTDSRTVCDVAGNCADAGPIGGNKVDKLSPSNPSRIRSTSHTVGKWSKKRRVAMDVRFASDGGSGVDGFSFSWTKTAGAVPDMAKDREQGLRSLTSPTLGNGRWYFHIRTRDKVGNWSGAAHRGPFLIDGAAPRVRALSASGKVNKRIQLRYRTSDAPSGKTREQITVTRGGARVASWSRRMALARWDRVQSLAWTPRSAGSYRLCVRAWDPAGNTRQGCAGLSVTKPAPSGGGGGCHPSYPTVCIPPPPPDLDCGDIPHRNFKVRPPDPHRFDGNGDGVGCET